MSQKEQEPLANVSPSMMLQVLGQQCAELCGLQAHWRDPGLDNRTKSALNSSSVSALHSENRGLHP